MSALQVIHLIVFLFVVFYAIYLFAKLLITRYQYIKLGQKEAFDSAWKERLHAVLVNVLGQRKLFKDWKSGILHLILFYGFFIIQVGLLEIILKGFVEGFQYPLGAFHPYFNLIQEWTVFLMFCAILYAAYRRYGEKLERLQWKRDGKALFVYVALAILSGTIILSLGFERIMYGMEANYAFAPFSSIVAALFAGIGTTAATVLFYVTWWIHMITVFSFMVFVPQSKQAHEVFAIFNVFFKKAGPVGKLQKIDFEDEEAESFGVGKIEDFTRRQLIDLYACVECGRCTNMCPATGSGKMLSPMDLMIKMRDHLTEKGAAVTSRTPWLPAFAMSNTKANQLARQSREEAAAGYDVNLIGDVITEEEIWACTTCRNCEDQCPVMNEHVDKIIDLRRYLVLTEGKMDAEAQRAMMNIERQGNPWGISRKERENWRDGREDIDVPTVKELKKKDESFEYLFFVGAMGSYDRRSQKVAQSFAKLLNEAGVSFAILGNKEKNSGDTPRRLGNEFLYQELAEKNISEFQKNDVKKIVTIDPHAYNTIKNEYPEFGLDEDVEVYHHTELLAKLIEEGKLKPEHPVNETITYHDSCYLGRYNDVYDPPRAILEAIPGLKIVEMERSRQDSMCCGAGGGMMWMEEEAGGRVNIMRTEQALAVNPSMIGSACPYCLTMLSDGTKAKELEDSIQTMDVAEILEKSVVGEKTEAAV
ncbi:heterodisulfide reductase-related iron-sulfur binding cluster [Aliibacillus thermotolerans]|uniref:Heterodisulfide reductase-related iron-sulfur binding cluster n=1 Tax=Aliibacillus thermotolerans TaxID=1834418 RepID=A0ABW0U2D2_9BACI|nr:heterodisulfide reductase-related iron-sulfur binding cluster [Aliibacillus thermotolerans]MDA3129403.1 4Fe-4S dicluster domain-containing protein [Aliibacillus thermotolerans]